MQLIPMVIEATACGERESDITALLNKRIVFLGTPIDDQIANLPSYFRQASRSVKMR